MTDHARAQTLRDALREVIDMLEGVHKDDGVPESISRRVQRAANDPAQQTVVIHELADLLVEAIVAGGLLSELAKRAGPPPHLAGQPGWVWALLREMADNMPDEVLAPGS